MKMNEDDDEEYQLGSESLSANINQEYEISETIPKKKKAKKNSKKRVRKAPPSKKQGATEIDVLQKLKSLVSNSTQLGNSSGQQNESMGVSQLKDLLNKIKIPLMSNASNNNSQKQTKAPAKNKKQSKTKKQVQIKQVMRTPMTRGKTRNKTPQNVSNPPQNVSKPQKQQNSNPTPKVPCSKTKVYTVKPGLAQLLSIESGTIKEISLKFINYALENGLVNHSSSTYMIFKDHQLRIIFGVDIIKTNELINILYNSHVIKEDEAGTAGSDEMNPMEKKRSEIVEKLLQG